MVVVIKDIFITIFVCFTTADGNAMVVTIVMIPHENNVRQYNSRLVDSEGCIALCTIIILVGVTNMRKGKDPPPSSSDPKKVDHYGEERCLSGEKVVKKSFCAVFQCVCSTHCVPTVENQLRYHTTRRGHTSPY